MSEIAISVTNVNKCYRVYENQRARIRHALTPSYMKGVSEVWALRDISFAVNKGESFAIIGRNGSGKSTLLEIVTKTLIPTSGEVHVAGRVAALLELGSGFNPEYTGRENVFLNGLLLGLSRSEVEQRFDNIASFADIGDVLDRPVKTYSSGMLVRLAFAVHVALDPEILIVDEALSVGDFFFQQKCFGRLRQMRENGLTLLFVSHDMGTVRDLCSTAVYLRKGMLAYVGDSKAAVRAYLAEQAPTTVHETAFNISQVIMQDAAVVALDEIKRTALWSVPDDAEEGRRLLAVRLLGSNGQPTSHAKMGETIKMQVFFRTALGESGHISLTIKNRFDQVVSSTGTYLMKMEACSSGEAQFAVAEFEIELMLEAGLYSIMFDYGHVTLENRGVIVDNTGWTGPLHIEWDYEADRAPFLGMFGIPVRGKIVCTEGRTIDHLAYISS